MFRSVFRLQFPPLVWYKPREAAEKPLWSSFSDAPSVGACKVFQIRRSWDIFFLFVSNSLYALDSFRVTGKVSFFFLFVFFKKKKNLKLPRSLLDMCDFYLSVLGVGKEEEYVFVCFLFFPGEAWLSPAAGDPSQQGRDGGDTGVPAPGRTGGVQEAPPAPLLPGRPRWRFCPRRPLRKAGDRRPSDGGGGKEARRGFRYSGMGTSSWI